jgi:predicted kinase
VVAIVLSGPQATGNTTLALALGTALGVPVFSRDPLMQALHVTATIRHYRADPGAGFRADAIRPVADLVADIIAIAGDGTTP